MCRQVVIIHPIKKKNPRVLPLCILIFNHHIKLFSHFLHNSNHHIYILIISYISSLLAHQNGNNQEQRDDLKIKLRVHIYNMTPNML